MKNLFLVFATLLLACNTYAQIPNGYYDGANGKIGTVLQQALHDIIDNHNAQSYSSLWTHFQSTDKKPNGKVWDMYSDIPGGTPPYEYTFVTDQCGSYSGEGSCYNREHSWPKSWFDDGYPMYTDMFHLVPTDGYVNGMRSNYPYGEVGSATWTSQNGSRLGSCATPGYNGTVFEPRDDYKGDFARNYFYMATRYYGEDAGWPGSGMVTGSQFKPWAKTMLLLWAQQDPVSQKEIDRNNKIYTIQNNRNPFIDHPEYANMIWGTNVGIDEASKALSLQIYPNPVIDNIHITLPPEFNQQNSTLSVYNSSGQELSTDIQFAAGSAVISMKNTVPGFYVVRMTTNNYSTLYQARIIKSN